MSCNQRGQQLQRRKNGTVTAIMLYSITDRSFDAEDAGMQASSAVEFNANLEKNMHFIVK
jgi:hypothetical protein